MPGCARISPVTTKKNATSRRNYPYNANGSVSVSHQNMANFLFCDGHVKVMHPYYTDPDPVNQPGNNMWNVTRP